MYLVYNTQYDNDDYDDFKLASVARPTEYSCTHSKIVIAMEANNHYDGGAMEANFKICMVYVFCYLFSYNVIYISN